MARYEPGTVLDSRFEVIAHLGAGGMARVYRALDRTTGRQVAVKVSASGGDPGSSTERRFAREFDVCRSVRHPNVVELFAHGRTVDGAPFIAMELVDGTTLDDLLQRDGPLPPCRVTDIVGAIAEALACLHAHDVVHRDLKPGNVMLDRQGRVVVMDFGLARVLDRTALTETGAMLGTPLYMSPELVDGVKAGPASDVWQVGALTYELLTGRRPFDGGDVGAIMAAILTKSPPPLASYPHVRAVADAWQPFVDRCLQKDPARRFASAAAVTEAVEAVRAGVPAVSDESAAVRPPSHSTAAAVVPPGGRRAVPLLVVAVLSLLVAGEWVRRSSAPSSSTYAPSFAAPLVHSFAADDGTLGFVCRSDTTEAAVRLLVNGTEYRYAAVRDEHGGGGWRVPLDGGLPRGLAGLVVEAAGSAVDGAAVVRDEAEVLCRRLERFDGDVLLEGLEMPSWNDTSAIVRTLGGAERATVAVERLDERRAALRDELRRRLRASGLLDDVTSARRLAPLVTATTLAPIGLRCRFVAALLRVQGVWVFEGLAEAQTGLLEAPAFGDFGLALEPHFTGGEVAAQLLRPEEPKLYVGYPLPFRESAHRRWQANFRVDEVATIRAAQVVLTVRRFHRVAMRVQVGDGPRMLVYGPPILYDDEDRPTTFYVAVPVELLRNGENGLVLEHENFGRGGHAKRVTVTAVAVQVLRRDRTGRPDLTEPSLDAVADC